MKIILKGVCLGFCLSAAFSCRPVKPYQMVYINDAEMQMGTEPGKKFEQYSELIREGATPATASKASGGCGCN